MHSLSFRRSVAGLCLLLIGVLPAWADFRTTVEPGDNLLLPKDEFEVEGVLLLPAGNTYQLNMRSTGGGFAIETVGNMGLPAEIAVPCGMTPMELPITLRRMLPPDAAKGEITGTVVLMVNEIPIDCADCGSDAAIPSCLRGQWQMLEADMPQYFTAITSLCPGNRDYDQFLGRVRVSLSSQGDFTALFERFRIRRVTERVKAETRYSGSATACANAVQTPWPLGVGRQELKLSQFNSDLSRYNGESCFKQERSNQKDNTSQAYLIHLSRVAKPYECDGDQLTIKNTRYLRLTPEQVLAETGQPQLRGVGRLLIKADALGRALRPHPGGVTTRVIKERAERQARRMAEIWLEQHLQERKTNIELLFPEAVVEWSMGDPEIRYQGGWNDEDLDVETIDGSPIPLVVEVYEVTARIRLWVEFRATLFSG